jgi:diacylglycerol O-acyltransferase / wax synthase
VPTEYDRLSAFDASFLHLERRETPMQVGAVAVLDGAPFFDDRGRFRLDDVRELVGSRLHLIPRFRKRIMDVPFGVGYPVWVDDDGFDIARHVHLTKLPKPGRRRDLLALTERLMSQLLDRNRPLWELWFVEGLDNGGHVGLIHKSHHTLTDGVSGVDIATVLLDFTPEPTVLDAPPWAPEPAPDPARLMLDTVCERVTQSAGILRAGKHAADAPQQVVDQVGRLARSFGALVGGNPLAPRLSLNSSVGPRRRLELVRVPLEIAKGVRNAFGCTVNDVVLAAVGGALARLLEARGELHDDLVVKVVCPVSVRDDSEHMKLGNRLSLMFVPIPVGERDPRARLDAVSASTADLKEREQALSAATLLNLSEYAAPTILGLAARAVHAQPLVNLMVTNVPGPQVPLYCLGAEMFEVYPIVPLTKNLTINIAVMSYCGHLHVGVFADPDAAPDVELLAGALEDSFLELSLLASHHPL